MKLHFPKIHGVGFISMLLMVAAVLLGADSGFAMAVTLANGATTEKNPDDQGLETQMPSVGANVTETVESGFSAEEIDQAIALFRPFKTPLEYSITMDARQQTVQKYEIIHYRSGTALFDATTIASLTSTSGSDPVVDIKFTGSSYASGTAALATKADLKLLQPSKVFHAPKGGTYTNAATATVATGPLSFLVLTNDGTHATALVLNPPMVSNSPAAVTIPSGSKLVIGVVAGAESQMIVAPDNFEPVPYTVYLQKRISNIVMTDEWIKDRRKAKFTEDDLRQNALYNFQVGNEINDWFGVKSRNKVTVPNAHMNDEFVYTSEGVLRQIKMFYSYEDGNLKSSDLNAIAKIQFTKYADNNTARGYCGKDFIENMLNMDLTVHKEIKFENVDVAGMAIKAWKNNFGRIDFVYTPVLDLLGFEKYCAVIDIQNAVHYVKRASKTDSVDMKKGVGENREAKREIYSRIDAIALSGYNSVLVGPSSQLGSIANLLTNLTRFATEWDGETEHTWSNGDVAYLTAAYEGFSAGELIEYNAATSSWSAFDGYIDA